MILSIDPGKEKCGLAFFDDNQALIKKQITSPQETLDIIGQSNFETIIIGQSHHGRQLVKKIKKGKIMLINEKYSTLEARKLYWKENKPTGFLRFIPQSLRLPPVPVDDYAAVILAQRYFNQ